MVEEVEFCKDVFIDPTDGEISFAYRENDSWYGTQRLHFSLEQMKELVKLAETIHRLYKANVQEI